ncbi:hypothetical protein [Pseudomonas sp. EMN2]|uniref:hypothetical protein n=1 Tax=Pseudomonas sp. EMN2 TaxID=2615212 RepID=UPI00129AC02C|nr:hypothetical protein [Pseudomonas sp. EMN2]
MSIQVSDVQPCSEGITSVVVALQLCKTLQPLELRMMDSEHEELVIKLRLNGGKESAIFVYDADNEAVKLSAVLTFEDFPLTQMETARELARQEAFVAGITLTLTVSDTGNLEAEHIIEPGLPTDTMATRITSFAGAANRLDVAFEKL